MRNLDCLLTIHSPSQILRKRKIVATHAFPPWWDQRSQVSASQGGCG